MKAVIQRVHKASVHIDGICKGEIKQGLVILLGVGKEDEVEEADILANKIANLRIFDDENGVMNLSLLELDLEVLIISQFTLYANCAKGRRPSYVEAAGHELATAGYERFIDQMKTLGITKVQTGEFGADMQVGLVNNGPVTICLDAKELRRK